jgi:hypothetical protein
MLHTLNPLMENVFSIKGFFRIPAESGQIRCYVVGHLEIASPATVFGTITES